MTKEPLYNDPEYWRARAEEIRVIADRMQEIQTKAILLRVAEDYDKLAERAETRISGGTPPE